MSDVNEPTYDDRRLSFGVAAHDYDTYRPTYPPEAVAWILGVAGRPVRDVADVGAGTGVLTQVVADLGYRVSAFEPDEGMLAQLRRRAPSVAAELARAEALPVEDDTFDALVVGQAFHWFDAPAASTEFRRVLRPDGVLGLLWNLRDDRAAWLAQMRPLIDGSDWQRASAEDAKDELDAFFPGIERAEFAHSMSMTPDEFVGLVGTFSFVRLHPERDARLASVREVLATHPETRGRERLDVPYVTAAYRVAVS